MSLWQAALAEAREDRSFLAIGLVLVVSLLVRIADPEEAIRLRTAFLCAGRHVLLLPAAGVMRAGGMPGYADVRLEAARENLDAEALRRRVAAAKHDLLGSIGHFFGLPGCG